MATKVKILDRRSLTQVRKKIEAMHERAQNNMPAWQALLDWWTKGNMQHFGTQGARWRTPWKELNPDYVKSKRREGWMGDTLVRSSDLRRSLTDRPLPIESLAPREMTAGTDLEYAAWLHYGFVPEARAVRKARAKGKATRRAKARRKRVPPRRLVNAAQVKREGAVTSAVVNWIVRGEQRVSALEVKR